MGNKYLSTLVSLPRSLCVCIRIFGIKGIKCPVLIANSIKIGELHKNCIQLDKWSFGAVKIGINEGSLGVHTTGKGYFSVAKDASIQFSGIANFAKGTIIIVSGQGKICIGNNFSSNRNCSFSSDNAIEIGDDTLFGWNVNVRTSDGHDIVKVTEPSTCINPSKPVRIGKHCWICANTEILKGTELQDNSIIGYGSMCTGLIDESNVIAVGRPAKVVKNDVTWVR